MQNPARNNIEVYRAELDLSTVTFQQPKHKFVSFDCFLTPQPPIIVPYNDFQDNFVYTSN